MDLIKITQDKERAKSIVNMTELIEQRIKLQDPNKMTALIIADYYEVIKELITAIMLVDGYKTLSHKDLIEYIKTNYQEFSMHDTSVLDDMRMLRNKISYQGFLVEPSYLKRNEPIFTDMIRKLKTLINKKL